MDAYLEFLLARVRPNSVLAAWFDLKVFFAVVGKPVVAVTPGDVFGFITAQRTGAASLPAAGMVPVRDDAAWCRCEAVVDGADVVGERSSDGEVVGDDATGGILEVRRIRETQRHPPADTSAGFPFALQVSERTRD